MRKGFLLALTAAVSGCARIPPVDFSYYPAKGSAAVAVIQSYDCSADKKRLVVATTPPVVTTQYVADHDNGPWTVEISKAQADLNDTDFSISFYDDGRLKGVNSVSTGQGEALLKGAISLIGAVLPLVGGTGGEAPDADLPECAIIANWGKGKPVTLMFSAAIDFSKDRDSGPINLNVSSDGKRLLEELGAKGTVVAPQVILTAKTNPILPAIGMVKKEDGFIPLKLQKVLPGLLEVTIDGSAIWAGAVLVPTAEWYDLPIPKAALFGKTSMVLDVAESGVVTKAQYASTSGAPGALNVLNSAATAATPDSAATKAAELKGQADLIVQSQRLARCRAQPDQCQ
ncbi:MAG: hypothetical protein PGN12_01790 [Sphingomonas phyllosphaerae]